MKRFLFLLCLALLAGASASAAPAVAVRMEETAALLDADGGAIVAEGELADIVPLGGELFAASTEGALYALMDAQGELLTPERYDELRLRDGCLLAHRDGGWGMLDPAGAEITSFDFAAILPTGAGGCWALRADGEAYGLLMLDEVGRVRFSALRALRWGEPGEGLLPLQTDGGLWGYCDAEGRLAIPARFEWAGSFLSGCAAAVEGGRCGAINADGEWIVAPAYERLTVSPGGFLLAEGEAGVAVISTAGELRAEYPGDSVWAALAGEGYAVCDGEALRVYDASGALLEELAPDAAVSEGVGAQLVLSEGMWGETCVRLSGTQTKYQNLYPLGTASGEPVYASMEVRAARYENDLLHEIQVSVDMDSARYGLVNGAGEPLLPCEYASIAALCDDRFLVRAEAQWRMIDSAGRIYWRSGPVEPIEAPGFD